MGLRGLAGVYINTGLWRPRWPDMEKRIGSDCRRDPARLAFRKRVAGTYRGRAAYGRARGSEKPTGLRCPCLQPMKRVAPFIGSIVLVLTLLPL
jgi:hypothetical protein